ncbi:Predicted kinase, aminoglycoside phosphotransferase (APT) family [Nocardioides alpinus]|uniref:Aminoglycoside phosphotransferase family protein n=1 Tax=Nocardioides alpinus TaxID=748909 RepID=A0A1I0ZTI9_9ACTN|nr:aminoglycoside phosphotransferase family protein [Nocardioides alpinus]PKH41825.1 aminoglycoside phosphotransferase family protein [Nocardioides alpinus]SFB28672.1 Predicted kinase, aminoglycoside phosphotransferase (APT) family [Nocardioides alpinus]
MQTSTHGVSIGETEVRKQFVADHEAQAQREWDCLVLLAEHAPGLAPRPLRREDGETPVIVMERIPGGPLAPRPLSARQTVALGASLRRLYDVPVQAVTDAGIGPRNGGAADPPSAIHPRLADHHDLSACRDPELVRTARAVAREWLRDPPLPEPRRSVLGIADLNPANVLWDGEQCRLVDFEDGGLSDPAYELADHVEHLGSRLHGVYDDRALVDAVGLDAEERERMTAYRPLWAAFWLAMLVPESGSWHRNPPGTAEAQAAHFMALVGHD